MNAIAKTCATIIFAPVLLLTCKSIQAATLQAATANQADVTVDDATACQFGSPHYVQIQPFGAGQGCCTGFQLNSGGAARVFVFELDEEAIAAFAIAPTAGELDIFVPHAEEVLFTLKFSRSS